MSLHETVRWIITYDIADPRRGGRLLRLLKKEGVPLQHSVFLVSASAAQLHKLMADIALLINPRQDDVRAYRWGVDAEAHQLGSSLLPDNVLPAAASAPAKPLPKQRAKTIA